MRILRPGAAEWAVPAVFAAFFCVPPVLAASPGMVDEKGAPNALRGASAGAIHDDDDWEEDMSFMGIGDPVLVGYMLCGATVVANLILFSALLPMKLDQSLSWQWASVMLPLQVVLLALPAFCLFLVLIAVAVGLCGKRSVREALKPFTKYEVFQDHFWVEVLIYLLPMGAFTLLFVRRFDGGQVVPIWLLLSPFLFSFAMGLLFNAFKAKFQKVTLDLFLIWTTVMIILKLDIASSVASWNWFLVLTPLWVLDAVAPLSLVLYALRSQHNAMRKFITVLLVLCVMLPTYTFQLFVAHRLQGGNRWSWVNIFLPVYVVEGVVFGPFIFLITYLFLSWFCGCLLGPKEVTGSHASARRKPVQRDQANFRGEEETASLIHKTA